MLKLKGSARISNRYLLLEGTKDKIEKTILDYIGILGWAEAAPRFVKKIGKSHVLAINRKALEKVRAAFALSADKIKVLKVSGTLKGLGRK